MVKILPTVLVFEWDEFNSSKSQKKHGIRAKESEEIFISTTLFVISDIKHSQKEQRFIALGQTIREKHLLIIFTLRKEKIRIISARKMHEKEVKKYETIKKHTNI